MESKTLVAIKPRNEQVRGKKWSYLCICKNVERSIPQFVAIVTVKVVNKSALNLWLLTAYEVFRNFLQYFRTYEQNDISSVFTLAVMMSYHPYLHIKMAASMLKVFLNVNILRTMGDIKKKKTQSTAFFPILSDLMYEINMFFG